MARTTPEQAAAAATRFTGLRGTPTSVKRVRASGDRTPFLSGQIAALGGVWEVTFDDVRLDLPSARGHVRDGRSRRAVVRIAESTGHFLSATLRAARRFPSDVLPTPDGRAAQTQLQNVGEHYHGLPDRPPAKNLLQALDAVLERGVGSPLLALEIQALYVTHSRMEQPPIAAWVITLNGIPPMPHRGPRGARVARWLRNHIRNVVDATSGQPLFANTAPQPAAPRLVS